MPKNQHKLAAYVTKHFVVDVNWNELSISRSSETKIVYKRCWMCSTIPRTATTSVAKCIQKNAQVALYRRQGGGLIHTSELNQPLHLRSASFRQQPEKRIPVQVLSLPYSDLIFAEIIIQAIDLFEHVYSSGCVASGTRNIEIYLVHGASTIFNIGFVHPRPTVDAWNEVYWYILFHGNLS